MKIIDKNFDNGEINGLAMQAGIIFGLFVVTVIILIVLFKALRVPNKIAGTMASLIFLAFAYYIFNLVISYK